MIKSYIERELIEMSVDGCLRFKPDSISDDDVGGYVVNHKLPSSELYAFVDQFTEDETSIFIRVMKEHVTSLPKETVYPLLKDFRELNRKERFFIGSVAKSMDRLLSSFIKSEVGQLSEVALLSHSKKLCFQHIKLNHPHDTIYFTEDLIKFENQPVSTHIKMNYSVTPFQKYAIPNIHFYLYHDELHYSIRGVRKPTAMKKIKFDYENENIAYEMARAMIAPYLVEQGFSDDDIHENNIMDFCLLLDMIAI